MYLIKVPKCPRGKSMMVVRLEFLGHSVICDEGNDDADDGEVSSWGSGQRDGTEPE